MCGIPQSAKLMDKALSILPAAGDAGAPPPPTGREIAQKLPQVIAIEQELAHQRPGLPAILYPGEPGENWLPWMGTWPPSQTGRPSGGERLPCQLSGGQYQCAQCGDTGFCDNHMCDCLRSLLKQLAYARMGEVSDIGNCKFENFSLDYYPAPGPAR